MNRVVYVVWQTRHDNPFNCHTEFSHQPHNQFKTSVWQSQRLSYRSYTRMTYLYIVILPLSLHLHHRYIHTATYTRTTSIVFQVFSSKTCWLLDFKHLFACWLLFKHDLSRYSAQFSLKSNRVRLSHLGSPSLSEFDRFSTESVTGTSCFACVIQSWVCLIGGLVQNFSKPSPWISNFRVLKLIWDLFG